MVSAAGAKLDDVRAPPWRAAVAACLVGTLSLFAGDGAEARSADVIWEGDDQAVVLARQDEDTAPPNEHPVTIPRQDIEKMLSGLRFRSADDGADTPPVAVFTNEQVGILGDALSTGLARASPSQDVTFSIVDTHRLAPGAFARRNRLTAGRAFFRDGKLNVIFGEIQSPYRKKNIYGRLEEDFYPREYGSRATPEAHESLLMASTGASLHVQPEGRRHDWIVFDASSLADQAPSPAQAAEPAPSEQPAAARSTDAALSGAATRPPGANDSPVGRDNANPDLEQRLETLKRLRDKDLISEEVYRRKVDEVLKDL